MDDCRNFYSGCSLGGEAQGVECRRVDLVAVCEV